MDKNKKKIEKKRELFNQDRFIERTKARIKELDLTYEVLAAAVNISVSALNSYFREKDPAAPSIATVALIARELDISLEYLIGFNEVEEFTHTKTITPDILLLNLYHAINDAGMTFSIEGGTVTITSNNHYISLFLSQVQRTRKSGRYDLDEVRSIAKRFKDLKIYKNQLVDNLTYDYMINNDRIYEDISEEEMKDNPEAVFEEIERRKK